MEAISHAGTCLGILANDGVLLAAEKKNTSKLLDSTSLAEKIFKIDGHVACSVAGITADANILVTYLRQSAQRYAPMSAEPCGRYPLNGKRGLLPRGPLLAPTQGRLLTPPLCVCWPAIDSATC